MNVNFQYSKTLAIEGSVLLLLGLIPTVGWVLGIVGIVLLFRATKELSSYYQDESIHQNAWMGLKYYIVALIAAAVAISLGIVSFAAAGLFVTGAQFAFTAGVVGGIIAILAGLVVAFVFYLLAALHLRNAYETLAQKTGESSFTTAGTLLLFGAIFTVVGFGLLLIFISWIYVILGFSTMRPKEYQVYNAQTNGYGYTAPSAQSTQQDAANPNPTA